MNTIISNNEEVIVITIALLLFFVPFIFLLFSQNNEENSSIKDMQVKEKPIEPISAPLKNEINKPKDSNNILDLVTKYLEEDNLYWITELVKQGNKEAKEILNDIITNYDIKNDNEQQLALAHQYLEEGNTLLAAYWMEKSAEQGNIEAQLYTGMSYLKQNIIPKGLQWITKSAEQDNKEAQLFLITYYLETGEGDEEKAIYFLTKMAKQNNEKTKQILNNIVTNCNIKDDKEQLALAEKCIEEDNNIILATYWMRKSAEQGNIEAQFYLGVSYLKQNIIIPKGLEWITKSAEQGNSKAQFFLGELYSINMTDFIFDYPSAEKLFVERDFEKAKYWLTKASEQGHINAKFRLTSLDIYFPERNKFKNYGNIN